MLDCEVPLLLDLDLNDVDVEELYAQAYSYYEAAKYKEAMPIFRVLVSLRVEDARFWNGLAASSQMLKEFRAAIESYAMAALCDVKNNDPFPHYYAAQCYHSLGEVQKGVEVLGAAAYIASKDERYLTLGEQIQLLKQTWAKHNKKR